MPVAFDAAAQPASGQTSTVSLSVAITIASNAVLIVGFCAKVAGASVSAVAQGANPLTQLGRVENAAGLAIEIWGLTAPAAGAVSISANFVGAAKAWSMFALTYTGAKAVGPFGTVVSGTSAATLNISFSLSSTTTDRVVGFYSSNTDISATNGTTRLSSSPSFGSFAFDIAGVATLSVSATLVASDTVSFLGVPIQFSAAATTGPFGLALMGCGL